MFHNIGEWVRQRRKDLALLDSSLSLSAKWDWEHSKTEDIIPMGTYSECKKEKKLYGEGMVMVTDKEESRQKGNER